MSSYSSVAECDAGSGSDSWCRTLRSRSTKSSVTWFMTSTYANTSFSGNILRLSTRRGRYHSSPCLPQHNYCSRFKQAGSPSPTWCHLETRLDYCNAVLAGLPRFTTAPLQRVQNAEMLIWSLEFDSENLLLQPYSSYAGCQYNIASLSSYVS